jgi:hypothetical protein
VSVYSPANVRRRSRGRRSARIASASGAGIALDSAVRWLYPRARDVVSIEPRAAQRVLGQASTSQAGVRTQVERWRRRVWRARAVVVLGRHLSVALALVILGLVVARIVTSATDPVWVFAGAAVMLVAALIALAMPITDASVATMLDSRLGLFERVQTALELELMGAESRLGLQVIAEAQEALSASFGTARARPRGSRVGLLAVVALAIVVALLLVLPGPSKPRHAASTHGGTRVGSTSGTVRAQGAAPGHKRPRGTVTLPVGAAVDESRPPLAVAPSTSGPGKAGGTNLYGHGAKSSGASILTKTGLSDASANTRAISAPGSASGLAGSKSASNGSSSGASGSAGGKAASKAGSGGLSAPGSAPSIAAGSTPKGAKPGGTPGGASASGAGSQSGQSQSQKAPPGGEQAGGTRGSTQLQAGLAPDLAQGNSGLPLQAGYAPTAAHGTGRGGISQTPNGGGGKARSAAGGSASGGAGTGRGATPIEPTPNTNSAAVQPLLSNYFGAANQLKPGAW